MAEPHDDSTRAIFIPNAGATIGRYTLGDRLGIGGMGEVWLAKDNSLNREVALKFLSPRFSVDESFRARFIREARAAAALNHPNVITIYEVGEHEGQAFIAMEFVKGCPLDNFTSKGSLKQELLLDIMIQICEGIAAAHARNMVHRDIKPGNIIIGDDGRVRILDFGLAKAEEDEALTQVGTAVGTVNYMSPEQAEGKQVGPRSDVFALGVVLYEAITGIQPFKRSNIAATLHAVVHDEPPPLGRHRVDLPEQLTVILKRALAKRAAERYPSAREMADDLKRLTATSQIVSNVGMASSVMRPPTVRSLAVLYLRNLGPDEDEFLCFGITEDLIVDLTRVGSVRVAPMRSVLKFKESDADLEEIAAKLNVGYVLDGSIHRAGEKIRVSAQLVDVASSDNLWAGRWEQDVSTLPKIKTALAQAIIEALQIGQSVVVAAQVGLPEAKDHEAYEAYLRGKYLFDQKKDTTDVAKALDLYRQALTQEPSLLAARTGIAEVLLYRGESSQAVVELRSAYTEAKERNQKADQAAILRLLARHFIRQSDWKEAWSHAEQALEIVRDLRDLAGEVDTLGVQIAILQPQARFDEALLLFDRVLEISRHLDDQERIGDALKSMGVVYARKGDFDRALDLYEEALELSRRVDNLSLQGACYSNIGNVQYFRGKYDEALEYYRQAWEVHTRLGDKAMAARPRMNMGLIELHRGNHNEGLELLNEAGNAFKELGDRGTYAMTLINISHIRLTLGEPDQARKAAERALALAHEISHPLAESDALLRLGNIALFEREFARATEQYESSLRIAEAAGLNRNVGLARVMLAHRYYYAGEYAAARKEATAATGVAKELGEKAIMVQASAIQAAVTAREGVYFAGVRQLRQACDAAVESCDTECIVHLKTFLGEILLHLGRSDEDRAEGLALLKENQAATRERRLIPEMLRIAEVAEGHPLE